MSTLEANGAVQYTKVDVSTSGDNTLVAAVSGKRLRVLGILLVPAAAVSVRLQSGSNDLSGAMSIAAKASLESHSAWGVLETLTGEALVLNLSGAVAVGGFLSYQEL